jgi:hypothetical protein
MILAPSFLFPAYMAEKGSKDTRQESNMSRIGLKRKNCKPLCSRGRVAGDWLFKLPAFYTMAKPGNKATKFAEA